MAQVVEQDDLSSTPNTALKNQAKPKAHMELPTHIISFIFPIKYHFLFSNHPTKI
jgi:hypothetical protein